jgi:heme a synthase
MIRLIKSLASRLLNLPIFSAARIPLYVVLSLVSQILIVVTGGVVRLTASGLGCPTWPKCTADSLVTVPAMGIHGIIEFTNRMLTFVLAVVAILTFVAVVALGKQLRKGLFAPALILGLGIPAQAVLGGFTVWSKLNPWFVGAHFLLSGYMIAVASVLVWRAMPPVHTPVTHSVWRMANAIALAGAVTVVIGVLVTGAGPHAGDLHSVRNGLDLSLWQHLHSYPAYIFLLLVIVQLAVLLRRNAGKPATAQIKILYGLLATAIVQAVIGVLQARMGVPPLLVGLHMLGASTLCSLLTLQWLSIRGKTQA